MPSHGGAIRLADVDPLPAHFARTARRVAIAKDRTPLGDIGRCIAQEYGNFTQFNGTQSKDGLMVWNIDLTDACSLSERNNSASLSHIHRSG